MESSRVFLTKEQAKSVLDDEPHSLTPSVARVMLGCNLTIKQAHALIDNAVAIELTGERARAMNYGIMIYSPDETGRGLRTNEDKLAQIEAELVSSGRAHEAAPDWWKRGEDQPKTVDP